MLLASTLMAPSWWASAKRQAALRKLFAGLQLAASPVWASFLATVKVLLQVSAGTAPLS